MAGVGALEMRRALSLPAVQAAPSRRADRTSLARDDVDGPQSQGAVDDQGLWRWRGLDLRKQEGLKGMSTGGGAEQTD